MALSDFKVNCSFKFLIWYADKLHGLFGSHFIATPRKLLSSYFSKILVFITRGPCSVCLGFTLGLLSCPTWRTLYLQTSVLTAIDWIITVASDLRTDLNLSYYWKSKDGTSFSFFLIFFTIYLLKL